MESLSKRNFLNSCLFLGMSLCSFKLLDRYICNKKKYFCLSKNFYLMGTCGNITIYVSDVKYGNFVLNEIFLRIKKLEFLFSKFIIDSDVSKLNLNPGIYNFVSFSVSKLLKLGMYINSNTFGYFDMGLGNLLSSSKIDSVVPFVGRVTGLQDMKFNLLDICGNMVKLNRPNSMLDLGGIAKGYTIDLVIDFLKECGVKHAAFEFGGDIKVFGGLPSGKAWKIYLDSKLSYLFNNKNRVFTIVDGSIAVSGGYFKRSPLFNSKIKHHIIDPSTLVSRDYYSISVVVGESAAICDALSTACYNVDDIFCNFIRKNFVDYNIFLYK